MKEEAYELEGADEIEILITKRRDGFAVILKGSSGPILQLFQIKGSIIVRDERAASASSPTPESFPSAQPSAEEAIPPQKKKRS